MTFITEWNKLYKVNSNNVTIVCHIWLFISGNKAWETQYWTPAAVNVKMFSRGKKKSKCLTLQMPSFKNEFKCASKWDQQKVPHPNYTLCNLWIMLLNSLVIFTSSQINLILQNSAWCKLFSVVNWGQEMLKICCWSGAMCKVAMAKCRDIKAQTAWKNI